MQIDLSPDGLLHLWEDNYSISLPATFAGVTVMADILRARQFGQTKLDQPGAPAQANIPALIAAKLREIQSRPLYPISTEGIDL